jgi:hypothetical protein
MSPGSFRLMISSTSTLRFEPSDPVSTKRKTNFILIPQPLIRTAGHSWLSATPTLDSLAPIRGPSLDADPHTRRRTWVFRPVLPVRRTNDRLEERCRVATGTAEATQVHVDGATAGRRIGLRADDPAGGEPVLSPGDLPLTPRRHFHHDEQKRSQLDGTAGRGRGPRHCHLRPLAAQGPRPQHQGPELSSARPRRGLEAVERMTVLTAPSQPGRARPPRLAREHS